MTLWLWNPGSVSTEVQLFPLLFCNICFKDQFYWTFLHCGAEYLEMVLSRKYTVWEFRQKDRNESRSPLCVCCLSAVLWGQQELGDVWSLGPRKYSRVSESVSNVDPHVWEESMTESSLSSWSFSLYLVRKKSIKRAHYQWRNVTTYIYSSTEL